LPWRRLELAAVGHPRSTNAALSGSEREVEVALHRFGQAVQLRRRHSPAAWTVPFGPDEPAHDATGFMVPARRTEGQGREDARYRTAHHGGGRSGPFAHADLRLPRKMRGKARW
jgi:hypothetical protein